MDDPLEDNEVSPLAKLGFKSHQQSDGKTFWTKYFSVSPSNGLTIWYSAESWEVHISVDAPPMGLVHVPLTTQPVRHNWGTSPTTEGITEVLQQAYNLVAAVGSVATIASDRFAQLYIPEES